MKNYTEKRIQGDDPDYFQRPNNPSELLTQEHFMPFLMQYIKDMKNECIEILIHPLVSAYLEECECSLEDLSTLDDDQFETFKDLHKKHIMAKSHRERGKEMDNLYDKLFDVLAKKVPTDNVTVKIDQIHEKVRLVKMPDDIVEEDYDQKIVNKDEPPKEGEEPQVISRKKNVNEAAVVIIKPGQVQEEEEVNLEIEHE